jgi:hypothetical protein
LRLFVIEIAKASEYQAKWQQSRFRKRKINISTQKKREQHEKQN